METCFLYPDLGPLPRLYLASLYSERKLATNDPRKDICRTMWLSFVTTLFFSLSAVTGYRTSRWLGGVRANSWRLLIGTVFLALWAHLFGEGLRGRALPYFLASGFIGFGIGDTALYQTLPRLGSRLTTILTLCLSAPIAAVTERVWLGTQLSASQWVSALAILAGVAIALAPGANLPSARRALGPGLAFGLLASLCQGLGAVVSRKAFEVAQSTGENIGGMTAAYQRILGGICISLLCLAALKWRERLHAAKDSPTPVAARPPANWSKAWPWVMANSLSGPVLGVSCFQWALKTTPSGLVLPIVALTPLVVIPLARWSEAERPTPLSLVGGAVAVAGAVCLAASRSGG